MKNIALSWSGGKDSVMALYELQRQKDNYKIQTLLSTLTKEFDRISMHGVRGALLEQQARSLGLRLDKIFISKDTSNDIYDKMIADKLKEYKSKGILSVAYGDIFLESLKEYRIKNLSKIGMEGIFPIWKKDTLELAHMFIDLGFEAVITCVDTNFLDKSFVGEIYNRQFLERLPSCVDPCGENGEFHSFVYKGPVFYKNITFKRGDITLRNNHFYFCDLLPA